ncbi:hypothetical protein M3Y96_00887300 [Aphelenchoides besseyi]|nr:hypothetical protein M3Y96_00887300 [Aphelenchoides besseyi]
MGKPKTKNSTTSSEKKSPKKLLGVNRQKARFGGVEVWRAFAKHYMKSRFESRMSSVDVRTRSNRSTAFLGLWRLALLSPNYNFNSYLYNQKAFTCKNAVYNSLICYNNNQVLFKRLARHEFYGSDQFIEIIHKYSQENRMFCFMNSIAIGYKEICRSLVVKAISRSFVCYGNLTDSYPLDFCDPYTQEFEIFASTLTVEYLFDLLYNLEQVLPQCCKINVHYYQWTVESIDLMNCFVQNHQNNVVMTEFVRDLKRNTSRTEDIHNFLKKIFMPRLKKRAMNFEITYIQPPANDESTSCSGPIRGLEYHEFDLKTSLQTVAKRPTTRELKLKQFLNNESELINRMNQYHTMRTRNAKRKTDFDDLPVPPAKTVCVQTTSKPQLRRSIVLETFIRFIIENQIVDVWERNNTTKNYTFTIGDASDRMWRMLFVNRDFALYFRRLLFQLHKNGDLDLTSRIVCTNHSRCTITNLFGFGCRMRSQVVKVLSHSFLPLFGRVVVKSIEDAEFSWRVPAVKFDVTVIQMRNATYNLEFVNYFVRELVITVSADSIELLLDILTNLSNIFPNCHQVEIIYLYSEPKRTRCLPCFKTQLLNSLAVDLKKGKISIAQFAEKMNECFFAKNSRIEFDLQLGCVDRTQWNTEAQKGVDSNGKTRAKRNQYTIFLETGNAIVRATKVTKFNLDYKYDQVLESVGIFGKRA